MPCSEWLAADQALQLPNFVVGVDHQDCEFRGELNASLKKLLQYIPWPCRLTLDVD